MNSLYFKILAAIAPALILAIVMIRKDRRREPISWLLAATGLGILCGVAVLIMGFIGMPEFPTDTFIGAILNAFVNAALPEEFCKFIALFLLANICKHFDEMFDGIVYAVCISMGFAGLENILYLVSAEDNWIPMGISRALLAVPMHYFFAIIMGSFFSLGWFDRKNRMLYMGTALLLPVIVHGLYDTLCFSIAIDENLSFFILIAFLLGFKYIRSYVKSLTNSMLKLDEYGTNV